MSRRRRPAPTELQRGAYELLRGWLATAAAFVAVYAVWGAMLDAALIPTAVAGAAGGLCGLGYHLTHGSRPGLATRLLTAAVILTVAAIAWAVVTAP